MAKSSKGSKQPQGGVHLSVAMSAGQMAPGAQMTAVKAQRIENLHVHGLQVAFAGLDWLPAPLPEAGALALPGELPPGSRLDLLRSAVFTGREPDLLALAQEAAFPSKAEAGGQQAGRSPIALAGLGGMGKTQLAVEFCYRYGRSFYGVHWLDARQEPSLEIAASGEKMALQPWPDRLPEQAALTERLWQAEGAAGLLHLALLDNVEDEAQLRKWLPRLRGLQVLFTSRQAEWSPDLGVRTHRLEVLPRPDSRTLLRALAPRLVGESDAALDPLSELLGDLPLGLHLAGSYLNEVEAITLQEYLDELKAEGALAHESQIEWTAFSTGLRATFELSWKRLDGDQDALARGLFLAAGWCAPNTPIPEQVLAEAAQEGEAAVKASHLARALKRLYDLGLLERAQGGPKVHPLLAEFARGLDADRAGLERLAQILEQLSGEAIVSRMPAQFVPLRAHVQAAALWSESAAPAGAGLLWNNLAFHLHELAEYAGAKAAFERSLSLDERVYGPEHPNVAIRLNNLANVLQEQGDLAGARAAFERALPMMEKAYGPAHPHVASCVNNLGRILQAQGDLAGARKALERALAVWLHSYGELHPQVALGLNNLGNVLSQMGDLAGAKAAFEQALHIDVQVHGPGHPDVGGDLNSLGLVLHTLGELERAAGLLRQAKAIWEPIYGKEHPKIATVENNLGLVLKSVGNLPAARAAFERALAIDEKVFGSQHPKAAIRLSNFGQVMLEMGDYTRARAAFEQALAINTQFYGARHPHVAIAISNLGLSYYYLGDLQGARAAFEQALEISELVYGRSHPEVASILNNLAMVLGDQGDYSNARTAVERSLAINQHILGSEHPSVAAGFNTLGEVLNNLGDLQGARAAYERALVIFEQQLGPEHPNVATLVNNLGGVRKAQGDLPGARAAYERALAIWRQVFGEQHPQVATGYNNLGKVLQALGDLPGARAGFERALAILEKSLPPEHPNIRTVRNNLAALSK